LTATVSILKDVIKQKRNPKLDTIFLSHAVKVIPLSVRLWLALTRLDMRGRAKAILNKARRSVPTSHEIWVAARLLLKQDAMDPLRTVVTIAPTAPL